MHDVDAMERVARVAPALADDPAVGRRLSRTPRTTGGLEARA
jgi:hypothetical protein